MTVAHNPFASRYAYVVAFNPNLTLKWTASLRDRLKDGCGVLLPIGGPGGCRAGQPANGVDPATNEAPAGRVIDQSSSSPVVTPDGGVIYGAYTRYNYARGHMFRFDRNGNFVAAFDFGWDSTPLSSPTTEPTRSSSRTTTTTPAPTATIPPGAPLRSPGPYYITQVNPNMHIEWQFKNTSQ